MGSSPTQGNVFSSSICPFKMPDGIFIQIIFQNQYNLIIPEYKEFYKYQIRSLKIY
jgi:hypothetical protein